MTQVLAVVAADWPAPPGLRALTTTRAGGVSAPPYNALNLGAKTDDPPENVAANRARLAATLRLPAEPAWLDQVHGARAVSADTPVVETADASIGTKRTAVCAVLTADCLPLLLASRNGGCWAAAHAGWRGLASGVIEAAVAAMPAPPGELIAWLGPAIGPAYFEVGPEVRTALIADAPEDARAFRLGRGDRYFADLFQLARARLARAGVAAVYGGGLCTVADSARFFSHRRDGATGRMASLIGWF